MSTSIESHPAAKIFPLSTGGEFAEFVASIRARGFDPAHPILLFQGLILDGRNRYRASGWSPWSPAVVRLEGRVGRTPGRCDRTCVISGALWEGTRLFCPESAAQVISGARVNPVSSSTVHGIG